MWVVQCHISNAVASQRLDMIEIFEIVSIEPDIVSDCLYVINTQTQTDNIRL